MIKERIKNKPKEAKHSPVKDGLYRRGNSWYLRCMVDGKLYRKSFGSDKKKANAVLAEIKAKRSASRIIGEMSGVAKLFKKRERRTFAEMADLYLSERPHLKPSTLRGYNEIFDNYLRPTFGHMYIDQITEAHIANLKAEISQKVSATRTNNILGPLRYILKVCVRRKLITDNPAINVDTLREEEPNIDPLSAEELERVFLFLKPHQVPLFKCLAWTGCRPDELFALRWKDVDFDRNEIHINKGRVRGNEGTPKTRSSKRIIYMFSIVKETLQALKKSPTQHVEGYVFLTKQGFPYDKHVDREWRVALKKAELRHRPAYQLRHTFASLCLANGAQPTWVAKMLGHSTPQITFKHYARFVNDASAINEERMEQFLKSKQNEKQIVHSFVHS